MNLVAWGELALPSFQNRILWGRPREVQRHWRTLFRGPVARASKQKNLALKAEAYCQPPNAHSSHTKFRSRPASDFEEANCVESWMLVLVLHILGYWRKIELRFPSLLHTTNTITQGSVRS